MKTPSPAAPAGARPLRALATLRREEGLAYALAYAAYRAVHRIAPLRLYRVRLLELPNMVRHAEPAPGFELRFLDAEEVRRFAEDPEADLEAGFAERVASGGHLCFAALEDGRLASYTWYAAGEVGASDSCGVPLRLPPDCVLAYKAYTLPAYRGRHLQGRLKQPVVEALRARGLTKRLAQIEWTNRASLTTSSRSGYRDVGWLATLELGGRSRALASPRLASLGIVIGRG